jgi:hypothetical protein
MIPDPDDDEQIQDGDRVETSTIIPQIENPSSCRLRIDCRPFPISQWIYNYVYSLS